MPEQKKLLDHFQVTISGDDLPAEAMDNVIEISVESSLHLPDMFTIQLHDEGLKWIDEGPLELGKVVEIVALPEEPSSSQKLITGEITALEPDFGDGAQATLLVRGYDRSHRLHRGTISQAYLQMTDSDLASKIAREAELKPQVDPTTEVYDYILQYNQTYMEFLSERAQRIGYEFYVEDKTLYFRKPSKNGRKLHLEWGTQLRSFSPRLTLVEQVDEVIVKGWDAKNRQVIIGRAERGQAEPETGQPQSGAQLASAAFKNARRVVVNRCVTSQAEADTLAQAICDEISGTFVEAEGLCYGQPELRAGKLVELVALGRQFNGIYYITNAQHIFRAGVGYLTNFAIHGRRPGTLYALMERASEHLADDNSVSPLVGIVTNNKDPEDQGRVKVKFPSLSEEVESNWARLVGAGLGANRGFYCLPEINDEVLVVFEHGDVNRPYILGGLWNGQDKPPLPNDQALENGKVRQRAFKTRVGHALTLTDGADAGLVLETAGGHRLTLADEKKQIVLKTKGGLVLTMDDSKKEISIEAGSDLSLKGTNLKLEATGEMSLKAKRVNINDGALEVT